MRTDVVVMTGLPDRSYGRSCCCDALTGRSCRRRRRHVPRGNALALQSRVADLREGKPGRSSGSDGPHERGAAQTLDRAGCRRPSLRLRPVGQSGKRGAPRLTDASSRGSRGLGPVPSAGTRSSSTVGHGTLGLRHDRDAWRRSLGSLTAACTRLGPRAGLREYAEPRCPALLKPLVNSETDR